MSLGAPDHAVTGRAVTGRGSSEAKPDLRNHILATRDRVACDYVASTLTNCLATPHFNRIPWAPRNTRQGGE